VVGEVVVAGAVVVGEVVVVGADVVGVGGDVVVVVGDVAGNVDVVACGCVGAAVVGAGVCTGCCGRVVCCAGNGEVVSDGDVGGNVVDEEDADGRGSDVELSALIVGRLSSVLSPSPPVKRMRAMIPRITAAAPAATAMIAPGCCHHGPGGGSYSGS
jgi:hypothetical protein